MQSPDYGDCTYANLWSADNNVYTAYDNSVVKTVYDPSPVGFKLPPSNVFTGFTTTGGNTDNPSEINGTWDDSSKGWNFYTDPSKSKPNFFPASGSRDCSGGGANSVGFYGVCWSAVPYSQYHGCTLDFSSSSVYPLLYYSRACGFGLRSSQE